MIRLLDRTGRLKAARDRIAQNRGTLVLTLHRVIPDDALSTCCSPRGMVLRESAFVQLLDYLTQHATLIAPEMLEERNGTGPKPRVLLTFDDGWADNYEVAIPIMAKHGAKACFFAVTAYAGTVRPFWPEKVLWLSHLLHQERRVDLWNRFLDSMIAKIDLSLARETSLHEETLLTWMKQFPVTQILSAIEETLRCLEHGYELQSTDRWERLMTWDDMESLALRGHKIASHTATHALLTHLSDEQITSELEGSASDLRIGLQSGRATSDWISYPNGNVDARVTKIAASTGYKYGFTTKAGVWTRNCNPLSIPRVNVWDGTLTSPTGEFDERYLEYALFWRPIRSRNS